jgi:hypothetical protein
MGLKKKFRVGGSVGKNSKTTVPVAGGNVGGLNNGTKTSSQTGVVSGVGGTGGSGGSFGIIGYLWPTVYANATAASAIRLTMSAQVIQTSICFTHHFDSMFAFSKLICLVSLDVRVVTQC